MAAARVVVFDANIASLFNPGNDVGIEARKQYNQIMRVADTIAPVGMPRAGQIPIRGAHRARYVPRSSSMSARYYVENLSGHALFVHNGTTGPIYPLYSRRLKVVLPGKTLIRHSVKGQNANPWITRAADAVLLKYGI